MMAGNPVWLPVPSHRAPLDTYTLTPTSVQDTLPFPKYWTPTLTPNDIMDPFIGQNSATLNGNLVKCLRPTVHIF